MKGIALLGLLVAGAATLAGCGTTTSAGHLNPAHDGYQLTHVAVVVEPRTEVSDLVEARLVEALTDHGIKAYKTSDITRFTPDPDAANEQIAARGAKELLYVGLTDANGVVIGGAQTQAYVSGNSVSATSTPIAAYKRQMVANVVVYGDGGKDGKPDIVVQGTASRAGTGLFSAGESSIVSGTVGAIMESLASAGVVK